MALRPLALLALALALLGCAARIPEDKADYVGDWWAPQMSLMISESGQIRYIRRFGTSHATKSGPLQGFEGDDIIMGIGPFTTRFKVTKPPYRHGGGWKMHVDGVQLEKKSRLP